MTGEMSASEVTRDAYPDLFALRDALKRRGIKSHPEPFDQYQGPYLRVPGVGYVWHSEHPEVWVKSGRAVFPFIIDRGGMEFEVIGSAHVHKGDESRHQAGCYTVRQAAKRIAALAAVS